MPETERPGYQRFELVVPDHLFDAIAKAAASAGVSVTAWLLATAARSLRVKFDPPRRGRPKKAGKNRKDGDG